MKKLALLSAISLAISGQAMAGGWKLPENSINGTALSAANVANAHGADASYYNPAAMVFNEDGASFEAALTLVHLSGIEYSNPATAFGSLTDETKVENIPVPTFHYVSPAMGKFRFGLSAVAPGGLSKRWKGVGTAFAEEFTLETIEINPTISYKVSDRFSVGGGLRVIYSSGVVRSSGSTILALGGLDFSRHLEGDSFDYGYNLALHLKATDNLKLSATYRSKIDLTEEGDAILIVPGIANYSGGASVSVPIPASLNLAAAYTFDKTTLELVLERTYWSTYKELDFEYDGIDLGAHPLDAPSTKNWEDSNTIRIGVTHQLDSTWTLMAGFAYDETPAPEFYAGFELPDSDAKIFSLGARYQYSDNLNIGAALLYDQKDELNIVDNENATGILDGATFEDASAYLLTVGVNYKF